MQLVEFFMMLLVGLFSGLVMSLVGASAVMIIVPTLNLVFSYGIHTAIGVSLLVDVIASLVVGYAYWKYGNVELGQGLWIALGSIVGAQLGSGATVALPEWFLAISYGLWMIGSGVTIWRKGLDRMAVADRFKKYLTFESNKKRIAVALALGFGIGVNAGIFGAGGGILIMMVLIFVLDYSIHKAVGTSTLIMAITAASAATGYGLRGNIDLFASLVLSFSCIVGGVSGAHLANQSSERFLARIVGVIFIGLGVAMTVLRLI